MQSTKTILSSMIILLLCLACNGPTATPTPINNDSGPSLLIEVEGEVQLKRTTWTDYHRVSFGTLLGSGDMLKPADDSRVKLLCADLSLWSVPAGSPSGVDMGCGQVEKSAFSRQGVLIGNTRGGPIADTIPYLISPRNTKLLTNQPMLRWNPVAGAKQYTIFLLNENGQDMWKVETTDTEIPYPANESPLRSGRTYLLLVQDLRRLSLSKSISA